MLTLQIAAFLSIIGLTGFFLGIYMDSPGVAALAALFLVVVGGMIVTQGLQHQVGEEKVNVDADTTTIDYVYERVGFQASYPVGFLTLIFGSLLFFLGMSGFIEKGGF